MGTIHFLAASGDSRTENATAIPGAEVCEEFLAGDREFVWVMFKGKRTCMLVNDSGNGLGLPINDAATEIYRAWPRSRGMYVEDRHIHGNAIVLEDIHVN